MIRVRPGFTLLELMLAVAIGAALLLVGRLTIEQLADSAQIVSDADLRLAREANAEALLRGLVRRVESAAVNQRSLQGDATRASFSTWCESPPGWLEACTATLTIVPVVAGAELVVQIAPGPPVRVMILESLDAHLLYLAHAGGGGAWLETWTVELSTPLAIGVVVGRDTLLIPIGERG